MCRTYVACSASLLLYRPIRIQCGTEHGTTGSLLEIVFSVQYPRQCVSRKCRNDFKVAVKFKITELYPKLRLSIQLQSSARLTMTLTVCSSGSGKTITVRFRKAVLRPVSRGTGAHSVNGAVKAKRKVPASDLEAAELANHATYC